MSRTIDYGNLMHRAMRGLIQEVLVDVKENGLPGQHHFFITFDTMHPDVEIAVITDTAGGLIDRLRNHDVEAAFIAEPVVFETIETQPVFEEALVLANQDVIELLLLLGQPMCDALFRLVPQSKAFVTPVL